MSTQTPETTPGTIPGTTGAPPAPRRRSTSTDIALIAAFAALIAVCALLPALHVSGLVPITLQTFAVLLSGAVLGARRGFLAVVLYVALGAAGLPIFSGGAAGLGVLSGPTAGYLLGFPLAAALTGFLVERLPRTNTRGARTFLVFLCGLAGSAAFIHTLGVTGLVLRADMSWAAAWKFELTFVPGDLIKNAAMALVASGVHAAFPDLLPRRTTRRAAATVEGETIPQ